MSQWTKSGKITHFRSIKNTALTSVTKITRCNNFELQNQAKRLFSDNKKYELIEILQPY